MSVLPPHALRNSSNDVKLGLFDILIIYFMLVAFSLNI